MFAVLHLPDFALQAVLRADPALTGRPVALSRPDTPAVACCTKAAQAEGVCAGQSLPQAVARCPALVIRPSHAGLEREAEAAFLGVAFSVCPQVELTAAGVGTLDLRGLDASHHQGALRDALARLQGAGFDASAGLAATPLRALYAAHHAGVGQIQIGDAALIASLPLAAAGPTPEQAAILRQWGLKTLGQLTALSKADITHRLGRTGLELWERANGGAPRPLRLRSLPVSFEAAEDFEFEIETLEPLLFKFRLFVDRLARDLANASFAAQALRLTLKLADEKEHEHFIRLPEPVSDAGILFRALHAYLETARTDAGITGMRLVAIPERSQVRQRGLFDGGLVDPHGFADTLARVAALVGSDRVGTPCPADTHRPDAFTLTAPPPTLAPLPRGFTHPPRGLALRRYRPPLPATVELKGREPAFVWTSTLRESVRAVAGPWFTSGDWWEKDRFWQREEWDVELEPGGLYRLVRVPESGWFLEGEYD
jgi:protein ImuB